MLTGRKLLLADDSAAIQKVIDLTFSDEGMKVTTVGDGRSALDALEHFPPPDIILADIFMPEVSGYEVCRQIKENERFAQIPVILLVSSFEPFDEAEAQRVGADDIVTKPFQSIRQLVSRVGSLVGGDTVSGGASPHDHSTLGLGYSVPAELDDAPAAAENNVTVLVEAPTMETHELSTKSGSACAPNIDMQTADTQQLERVDEAVAGAPEAEWRFEDTVEVEPAVSNGGGENVAEAYFEEALPELPNEEMNESVTQKLPAPVRADETLLEIDDDAVTQDTFSDDLFLDLDFEEQVEILRAAAAKPLVSEEALAEAPPYGQSIETVPGETFEDSHEWAVVAEPAIDKSSDTLAEEETSTSEQVNPNNLSVQAIDQIAERVVQRLSDKVVREIAWEVVPELAELLIRRKLEDEK